MNDETEDTGWPAEAGDPNALAHEIEPPAQLEGKVVRALLQRGLIDEPPSGAAGRGSRVVLRAALTAAAALVLVMGGFLTGRVTAPTAPAPAPSERPALFALLLYETPGFARADGGERRSRYDEYSRWVAEARRRGQFVTGEDLASDRGFVLTPAAERPRVTPGVTAGNAALSGIFLVTATDAGHAVELAESLPHLRHGGSVVVQQVLPTDVPPPAGG